LRGKQKKLLIMPNDNGFHDDEAVTYAGVVHVLRMWTHYE